MTLNFYLVVLSKLNHFLKIGQKESYVGHLSYILFLPAIYLQAPKHSLLLLFKQVIYILLFKPNEVV